MEYVDDRGFSCVSHRVLIGGIDDFMSGWGRAKDGKSYAFWGCKPEDEESVMEWVSRREEFRRIRTIIH